MTAADLNPELRNRIDARLDAIDRILVRAEVTWSERRSIVGEVETQVYELLARRGPTPTEEDVAEVLDSLDPPEAYVPEELRERFADAPEAAAVTRKPWPQRCVRLLRVVARGTLCVLAFVVINGAVIAIIVASDGFIPWVVTLGGLAWLNYEAVRRLRAWSAVRQGSLVDDVCHGLGAWCHGVGAWLLSKGSAQAT